MTDLISREEAIKRATADHDFYRGATLPTDKARRDELLNVMCWLNELPSAEPQWIPVSEKLPEYYEPVLTWDGGTFAIEQRIPYICDENGWHIQGNWWVSADYDEIETDYYPGLRDGAAIAWMPLPKPYKGDIE